MSVTAAVLAAAVAVLADLEGPGVVSHIWLTVAASEYGWPRLTALPTRS